MPNQPAANSGTQIANAGPGREGQPMLRSQGNNPLQPGSQTLSPLQITNPNIPLQANLPSGANINNMARPIVTSTATTGPMEGVLFQNNPQIERFLSSSLESQKDSIMKLQGRLGMYSDDILPPSGNI